MSKLLRFRKSGGFQQLLFLIETCEPEKQKSLLHMVACEDPGWAHLIKVKALTFQRILTWPVEILMEITPHLQDSSLAMIYRMAEEISDKSPSTDLHNRFLKSIPETKAHEVIELANGIRFTPGDQMATVIRLLQTVRELEAAGKFSIQYFDPGLHFDIKITVA